MPAPFPERTYISSREIINDGYMTITMNYPTAFLILSAGFGWFVFGFIIGVQTIEGTLAEMVGITGLIFGSWFIKIVHSASKDGVEG